MIGRRAVLLAGSSLVAGRAYAGDFDGNVYCSTNSGVTWVAKTTLNAGVNGIRVLGGTLYYLTDGAGMVADSGTCP